MACWDIRKPALNYSLFDKNRKLINRLDVEITTRRMAHDCPITENHVIFPDLPMEFSPEKVIIQNKGPVFQWDNNKPSRYGIMKKMANSNSQI